MRFRCPRCQTGYELPLESIPAPGDQKSAYRLKCVRCKCIFLMTVEMAAPNDLISGEKDVYFELISPNATPDIESADTLRADAMQRLRFEFRPVQEGSDSSGPTVSKAESWEKNNTLELSEYAIGSFRRAAHRKAWIAGGLALLLIGLLLYIAAMNNWSVSINRIDQDLKRAFFLQSEAEVEADLLQNLDVTLGRGYTLRVKKGKTVGVIKGEIQNNSQIDVTKVLLKGKILDGTQKTVMTVIVPCGVKLPDKWLRKTRNDRIPFLYKKQGQLATCTIKSGYSASFKVVFHELPKYFNSTYVFEVHPFAVSESH